MGGYVRRPREAVWKHKLVAHETVVLTPTGGGIWTPGGGDAEAPPRALDAKIAAAPFENDLLLSIAGDKMIIDNEFYCRGGMDAGRSTTDSGAMPSSDSTASQHILMGEARLGLAWHPRQGDQRGRELPLLDAQPGGPADRLACAGSMTSPPRSSRSATSSCRNPGAAAAASRWSTAGRTSATGCFHPELPDKTEIYHQALKYSPLEHPAPAQRPHHAGGDRWAASRW